MEGRFGGGASKEGLTLVELLVVMGILAVLSSILLPVLSRGREKARQSACSSNLRQIGMALAMYRDDWDGVNVKARCDWSSDPPGRVVWREALAPYAKEGVFICPSFGGWRCACAMPNCGHGKTGGYALNTWPGRSEGGFPTEEGISGLPDPEVEEPSFTIAVYESLSCQWYEDHDWPYSQPAFRHNGGTNLLFMDGHVKWVGKIQPRWWTPVAD